MRGLFVSTEHQVQASLRTHNAYRLAAYILIACIGLQIPFALHMLKEKRTEADIRQKTERALAEKTRILSKSQSLQDVLKKVQEAQRWTQVSYHKIGASEILSCLEESVSEGICLTEITIQNRSQSSREPDRFEVEIRGYGKAREPEAWTRSLEDKLPSWKISQLNVAKSSGPQLLEGLSPFSVLLQQPTNP